MKNRRNIIVAFLLCACMIVGVGYAAFSDVMDITGTTEMKADEVADGNIIFTKATAAKQGDIATVNATNKDKASFTVTTVVSAGEQSDFDFEITNTNSKAYNIAFRVAPKGTNDDATTYYTIASTLTSNNKTVNGTDGSTNVVTITENGGTAQIHVTVAMKETPAANTTVSANFQIELIVTEITNG